MNTSKLILLVTSFINLSAYNSFAQNSVIDSLQQVLNDYNVKKLELQKNLLPDESDTTKVNILIALGQTYCRLGDFTTSKNHADEALSIANQIGYKKGIAKAYNLDGILNTSQGNYMEGLSRLQQASELFKSIGDERSFANSHNNIGNIYYSQGNYAEALKNYLFALKIHEQLGDKTSMANTYNNIGLLYRDQGNFPEALENHYKSLKLRAETGDEHSSAASYNNIGLVHSDQGNYPEALKNYLIALNINKESGNKVWLANNFSNIGEVYNFQANYPEAIENYFSALKIREEIGDKNGIASSCKDIGIVNMKLHKIPEAKTWLMKGLYLAREIGVLELIRESYKGLAAVDSALGNYKGAYENHKLFVVYRDSLNNEEVTKKTLQTKMQYEFDKKEAEIKAATDAELKKQKLLKNGFVGGFAVVFLFAGVFFRQRNRTKREKQRSEALLLNILPGEVAEEIKTKGTVKAKAYTMATVMFTDFIDFTNVSEKVSAELLVDEIHHCFSAFDNILHKYKIEKIKTIGDAYLCASGLPLSNYSHAQDMLNASVEIRNFMLQRKKEKEALGEIPFEIRIGIHTGPVVAGVVGVKKYAYDIWGDTVNIAARMEQNSEAGKINISGTTYELVKDLSLMQSVKFNFVHRGKIPAKNKGNIDMYFVEIITA